MYSDQFISLTLTTNSILILYSALMPSQTDIVEMHSSNMLWYYLSVTQPQDPPDTYKVLRFLIVFPHK